MAKTYKTWSQKMAEVRKKDAARRIELRRKQASQRRSVVGGIEHDFFDVVTQLVGVTNEWTGTGKQKKKKRR